jgi:tRNA-Thr(GGU) m(6)t(6)A37 methyltransferase TsaA
MSHMGKKMALPSDGHPEFEVREGERKLPFDPAGRPGDAGVVFVGRVSSPWTLRSQCPKNMREAAEKGGGARLVVDAPYRPGLAGLERFSHAVLLSWLDRSPRDLIVQKPRHAEIARGTFALRSPVRPNPVGLHVVRVLGVDPDGGTVDLAAIDLLDGTPILDIKPYFASTDAVPDALPPLAPA